MPQLRIVIEPSPGLSVGNLTGGGDVFLQRWDGIFPLVLSLHRPREEPPTTMSTRVTEASSALEVLAHAVRSPDTIARNSATPADLQFLEEQVNEHNVAVTGIRDARDLVMLLRDPAGRIYAGLSGHTWGGAAEVRLLWVDESRRHAGIGSRLLRAAEQEARARGCSKIVLSTHSFQAPGFYLKYGYVAAGEIANYPQGHRQIYLEKSLA